MALALTLVSPDPAALALAEGRLEAAGLPVKDRVALGPHATDFTLAASELPGSRASVTDALAGLPVDHAVQPEHGRRKSLFLADMDSTIIGCECLDELADLAGVGPEVAAVTERAMRGELAFEPALRERVARLRGLPLEAVAQCLAERVRLNPGARILVRTLAANGVRTVLVSGGFESFTGPVAGLAGFAHHHANRLRDDGRVLTGEVAEPILGRDAKQATLALHAQHLGVGADATLAVGDGANDLAMVEAAGLGVAYRAKPVLAERADARVDHADLTALLYFQGYRAQEFVRD